MKRSATGKERQGVSRSDAAKRHIADKHRDGFSRRLIDWQRQHGRSDLPWQNTRDPYRIWLSEVMLQQTQVATVMPYYLRFLQRFPDVVSLAAAELDEVLTLWSGLGYYSRARNLHAAAQQVAVLGGFPSSREGLEALRGVGRSTAAAIAAFAHGQREAILDGNVKRVLARHFAVEGFPGERTVEQKLWSLAESLLPARDMETYTQALMDLGATLCTRSRPRCDDCPLKGTCRARAEDRMADLPGRRPRKPLPAKRTVMPIVLMGDQVLLVRRPPSGIWGGLLSLPEYNSIDEALLQLPSRSGCRIESHRELEPLAHGFTHYSLTIQPLLCEAHAEAKALAEPGMQWLPVPRALQASIPAPVRSLLLGVLQRG